MGKRKKKILFDVFGGLTPVETTRRHDPRGKTSREPKGGDGEFRIPQRLMIVAGSVFIVIVVVSYYFGSTHGASRARKGEVALESRTRSEASPKPQESSRDTFAVKALSKSYTRYTRAELEKHMRTCCRLLIDEGYEPVDLMVYEDDKKKGTGEFVLWVGSWTDKAACDQAAKKVRGLALQGNYEFRSAYSAIFR